MWNDEDQNRAEKRKARRLARQQARAGRTPVQQEERARVQQRAAAILTDNTVTVPLMLGEITVGKATISSSGHIIARVSESSVGKALYPLVQQGIVPAIQLGPSLMPEVNQDLTVDLEDTLFKVRDGLLAAGLDETQVTDSISQMLNKGVLFRERRQ